MITDGLTAAVLMLYSQSSAPSRVIARLESGKARAKLDLRGWSRIVDADAHSAEKQQAT